jgi:hypothetical protein
MLLAVSAGRDRHRIPGRHVRRSGRSKLFGKATAFERDGLSIGSLLPPSPQSFGGREASVPRPSADFDLTQCSTAPNTCLGRLIGAPMRIVFAIVVGLIATAANAGSCQFIANRIYCDNGLSGQRLGSFTYWNDGFTSRHAGNYTYNSDGSSSQRVGNHIYYNDGSSSFRNGDFTYFSDGTRCHRIVNQVHCD